MPGLPYQKLPAEQVNKIHGQLRSQWQIEAGVIEKTVYPDRGKFEAARAKLNAKYQMMELKASQELQQEIEKQQKEQAQREQLLGFARQRREGGVPQEQLTQQRLGMTAGQWTATTPSKGLSPAQMEPPSKPGLSPPPLLRSAERYAEDAPTKSLWFTRESKEPKTKEGLADAYNRWKDWVGYDDQNYAVRDDLDRIWDRQMVSSSRFDKWWKNIDKRTVHQDIKITRHKGGKYASAMRVKVLGKSPLARSIKTSRKLPMGGGMYFVPPQPQQQILTATNPQTGQRITSRDGGRTWGVPQ